jgi:hypothetical protein
MCTLTEAAGAVSGRTLGVDWLATSAKAPWLAWVERRRPLHRLQRYRRLTHRRMTLLVEPNTPVCNAYRNQQYTYVVSLAYLATRIM